MGVLQRILPRGLYWRAALILLVPIVTIQLVVSTAFIQRHYEGVTLQMTNGVAIDLEFLLAEIEAPDGDIEERRVGGLGLSLVRSFMDRFDYRRDGGFNRVNVEMKLKAA